MVRSSPRRRGMNLALRGAIGGMAVGVLLAACSAAGGSLAPSEPAATTVAASATVAPTLPATEPASPSPSTPPSEAASPSSADVPAGPPAASLAAEGGDPVVGMLGSYPWAGDGSDSPWLPGAPMRVGSGEWLSLTLAPATGVETWTAVRVKTGTTDGSGAVRLGSGTTGAIAFDAPPAGHWSVQVAVRFAGGLGSAVYYWRLDVS